MFRVNFKLRTSFFYHALPFHLEKVWDYFYGEFYWMDNHQLSEASKIIKKNTSSTYLSQPRSKLTNDGKRFFGKFYVCITQCL